MEQVILLKLGEVVLKGLNRRKLEEIIIKTAKTALENIGACRITSAQSTLYVTFDEDFDADTAIDRLSKVFGIAALTKQLYALSILMKRKKLPNSILQKNF